MRKLIGVTAALLAGVCGFAVASSGTSGQRLAQQMYERHYLGFGTFQGAATLTIKLSNGNTAERRIDVRMMEVGDGEVRSLAIVREPMDMRNTALLTYTQPDASQQQWMRMPSIGRTKRLPAMLDSAFLGSEFTFADVSLPVPARFTFEQLPDETLAGTPCLVLKRRATNAKGRWEKIWLDKDQMRLRQVHYFDAAGDLRRAMTVSGYQQVVATGGRKLWRPTNYTMRNVRSGAVSVLTWTTMDFAGTDVKEREFEISALDRRNL